jgi:hypothetical protein
MTNDHGSREQSAQKHHLCIRRRFNGPVKMYFDVVSMSPVSLCGSSADLRYRARRQALDQRAKVP